MPWSASAPITTKSLYVTSKRLIIHAAAEPGVDALVAFWHLPEQRALGNAGAVQPFLQQPHRTERAGAAQDSNGLAPGVFGRHCRAGW
jgi:hypothetical protein